MTVYLGFERAIEVLATSAAALRRGGGRESEAALLDQRAARQLADLYARLTPWQRTQVARHPERPHVERLVGGLFSDFVPLAGDRTFGDDAAVLGGPARFQGRPVVIIGHAKGEGARGRARTRAGMGRPEGFRKAVRLMDLADRFGLPVVTFVDTPGAAQSIEAEDRGQALAIARCLEKSLSLGVPVIAVIVGEGGSEAALALAAANRVLMLENAIYSVISPEGCAAVLWRDVDRASDTAKAMKITAPDLLRAGIIHRIVYEPTGGAHRDAPETVARLATALGEELDLLSTLAPERLRRQRQAFFMELGRT